MPKRAKRPQQGTHGPIRSLQREANLARSGEKIASALVDINTAMRDDPDLRAYADAQTVEWTGERAWAEIARLLPILRAKYGGKTLLSWHRAKGWKTP